MISLDVGSSVPPYEQVRSQIAAQIRSGALPADHRLPSIRQLAGDLRVAPGTVARAYTELEQAGLIITDRRRGSRVCYNAAGEQGESVRAAVEVAIQMATAAGLTEADLVGMVTSAWRGNPGEGTRGTNGLRKAAE